MIAARHYLALWLAVLAPAVGAEEQVVDIRQGTNIAVTLSPDGTALVTNLLGGLWRLPANGGGAIELLPAGQGIEHPQFAPDGRSIVLQRYAGQWDLWIYDLGAASARPLTDSLHDELHPVFSPDGRAIVYASNRSGNYALWSMDLATGMQTQLSDEPGDSYFPAVADTGEIAYVNRRDDGWTLRQLAGNGAGTELLRRDARLSAPSWRPGGGVIVFLERDGWRSSRLRMLLLSDEGVVKDLTTGEDVFESPPTWISPAEYVYTADGQIWRRSIAGFVREPVHMFAALSLELTEPAPADTALAAPGPHVALGITGWTVSSDERRAAFAALGDIWLSERRSITRLTDDAFLDVEPSLTPDGSRLVFVSDRAGNLDLWQMSLDNGEIEQLTAENAKAFRPAIGPSGRFVAYLESEGLGPWAATRLRLLDLQGNSETNALGGTFFGVEDVYWALAGREPRVVIVARPDAPSAPLATLGFDLGGNLLPPGEAREPARASGPVELPDDDALLWSRPAAAAPYVIQVGRLFDGVGNVYARHVDIHIEGPRIVAIVGRGLRPLPDRVIDARDATVIPGLIDVRAHQSWLSGERLGRTWLAYGVTTVRELPGDRSAAIARAETWASARQAGPRLIVAPPEPAAGAGTTAPAHVRPLGNGFGHDLMQQSRRLGFPQIGDTTPLSVLTGNSAVPDLQALAVSPLLASYQDTLGVLIGSRSFVSTGLAAIIGGSSIRSQPAGRADVAYRRLYLPQEQLAWPPNAAAASAAEFRPLQNTLARLVRGGANVAIGTDAPAVPYGYGVHQELQLLVDAGIAPDQALRLATARGAMALGLEHDLGTLEAGKLADLIVIDGDPLARIADTLRITAVVHEGRWFDRSTLLEAGAMPTTQP